MAGTLLGKQNGPYVPTGRGALLVGSAGNGASGSGYRRCGVRPRTRSPAGSRVVSPLALLAGSFQPVAPRLWTCARRGTCPDRRLAMQLFGPADRWATLDSN